MQPPSVTTTVDLYLANSRLRAELPSRGFGRLSDVLNNLPSAFINGTLLQVSEPTESGEPTVERQARNLVVRLQDVLFVRPLDETSEAPTAATAERRDRLQQRMVVQLDDWRIIGNLHLVDQVRWLEFVTAANSRFVPMTQVAVLPPGHGESIECPFVLVNGARLSAIYEAV